MVDTNSAVIPRTGGSFLCGSSMKWTGSYKVTAPDTLNVDLLPPASTTLTTSLSGEAKSGEEITVFEGAKVKDQATLSGTNAASATGTIKYFVYSDNKCEKLVTKAGETAFSEGKVPASEEKTLEAGAVYYWQAEYSGDSKNAASKSTCGKEVLTVKALVTTSLDLLGVGAEEAEGEEISVPSGTAVLATATLSGTNAAKATGSVDYFVYSDSKCEKLVSEAGEVTVAGTIAPSSDEETLEEGTYYWQAVYSGGPLHQASISGCGSAIVEAIPPTSLSTTLTGGGKEGAEIEVTEGTAVTDTAKLSGKNAAKATGSVEYSVYSDPYCKELVASAGKVTVSEGAVPASTSQALEAGVYFWKAEYSGDGSNHASKSACGAEILVVMPRITTELSGGGRAGEEIEVPEGTLVTDSATLHGAKAAEATGSVEYFVYPDSKCEKEATKAGKATVAGAKVPSSTALELKQGTYYWVAKYSGDPNNPAATSACGSEVLVVTTPTSLTTTLSGGSEEGAEIEVKAGTAVLDSAELTGVNAAAAEGAISYAVYGDSECTEMVTHAGGGEVNEGSVPPSDEVVLPAGTYYWQATYTGDGVNHGSTDTCGAEIQVVTGITTVISSGEQSGTQLEVTEGAGVTGAGTLHGPYASEAIGFVEYFVYADNECEGEGTKVGKVTVEGASVPSSPEIKLKTPGVYYWQAVYNGDGTNPAATSACEEAQQVVAQAQPIYASIGDSFSSGEGINADGGAFYKPTELGNLNECHRSPEAWPALVGAKRFGAGAVAETPIFDQQPKEFIFRACSGAETHNLWGPALLVPDEGGQWREWISGPPQAKGWTVKPVKPAQNLWLGDPTTPNGKISTVMLTIGGNDAGFGPILRACLQYRWVRNYSPDQCLEFIASREATFGAIQAKIVAVLKNIAARAPKARIVIPVYPSMLVRTGGRIPVFSFLGVLDLIYVNDSIPGDPKKTSGLTAIGAMGVFTERLNATIRAAVKEAAANKVNARVIEQAYLALEGHRFGEAGPLWANKIVLLNTTESFHPNRNGHKALFTKVYGALTPP
ncbi:MAG TPA: hypothetical protein VFT79_04155 [Solirubrobacterales bacterium]|nr:hypothetical protein [Solirubrobacterales bacterium]